MLILIIKLIAERMGGETKYSAVRFSVDCEKTDAFNHDGHDISDAILDGDESLAKSLLCGVIDKQAKYNDFFLGEGFSARMKEYVNSVAWTK